MIRLKNWSMYSEGDNGFNPPELWSYHLQGNVYGHPRFDDGDPVNTSRIIEVVDKGDHKEAHTRSGSVYWLYKEDVDPECEKMYPNYYERFKQGGWGGGKIMKRILIIAATLLFSSIGLMGCTKTELNVNMEGEVTNVQSSGFVKICDDPIPLSYDTMTRIIYIKNRTYSSRYVYTPYYAPNGLPYRYNPETNTFEEIE